MIQVTVIKNTPEHCNFGGKSKYFYECSDNCKTRGKKSEFCFIFKENGELVENQHYCIYKCTND